MFLRMLVYILFYKRLQYNFYRFLRKLSDMYSVENYCEVNVAGAAICLVAFCIPKVIQCSIYICLPLFIKERIKVNWPPLYFLILLFFSELLVVCLLGTILEMAVRKTCLYHLCH